MKRRIQLCVEKMRLSIKKQGSILIKVFLVAIMALLPTMSTMSEIFAASLQQVDYDEFVQYQTGPALYGVSTSLKVTNNTTNQSVDTILVRQILNGESVYCIEPMIDTNDGFEYTATDAKLSAVLGSLEQQEKIQYLSYFGYGYNGDNSLLAYGATQIAIWEWQGYTISNITSTMRSKVEEIKTRANNRLNALTPSFNGSTIELLGYGSENAITLNDTNGVFNNYYFTSSDFQYSRSGNNLTIWTNSYIETGKLKFQAINPTDTNRMGNSIVFINPGDAQKIASIKLNDPLEIEINVRVVKGTLEIGKKDTEGNYVPDTGFKVSYNSDMSSPIGTYLTGSNGKVTIPDLLPQKVYIQEVSVPANLVIDTTISNVTIIGNETVGFTKTNSIQKGEITLEKQDRETGATAQGDAILTNAKYGLYARENIVNPITGAILINKGALIDQKTTDANRKITWSNLYLGEYEIKEIEPSTGYNLNTTPINVSLTYGGQTVSTVSKSVIGYEDVIKGKITIFKTSSDGRPGVLNGLKDVEFTVKLWQDVLKLGWDDAPIYDVITTNGLGFATTSDLPYGVCQIRETMTPENHYKAGDFLVDINVQDEIEFRAVNNAYFKSHLKLIKTNSDGERVTLSNASFQLKDSDGNIVTQKVSGKYYDIFTTDENGEVQLPTMLDFGTYKITEIETPDGMLNCEDITVEISTDNPNIIFDEEDEPVIVVKVVNEVPKAKIVLHKMFEEFEKDLDLFATFEVYADCDILNPATGEIIYKNGDLVGTYTTNEELQVIVDNLPMSTGKVSYKVVEVDTTANYTLSDPVIVEFEQTDDTTKEYTTNVELENKLTTVEISKKDATTGEELPGALLQLFDKDGNLVEEWISTDEPHIIKGLERDKEYTLHEDTSPLGYKLAQDITFIVGQDEKVEMHDELILTDIRVNKVDAQTKKAIVSKDFEFTMYADEACAIEIETIQANTEDGTVTFKDVAYGIVYIKETKAPEGYELSDEVKTVVLDDNLEGIGDVYSFEYVNVMLPTVVIRTGDDTNISQYVAIVVCAAMGVAVLYSLKKRKDK